MHYVISWIFNRISLLRFDKDLQRFACQSRRLIVSNVKPDQNSAYEHSRAVEIFKVSRRNAFLCTFFAIKKSMISELDNRISKLLTRCSHNN